MSGSEESVAISQLLGYVFPAFVLENTVLLHYTFHQIPIFDQNHIVTAERMQAKLLRVQ